MEWDSFYRGVDSDVIIMNFVFFMNTLGMNNIIFLIRDVDGLTGEGLILKVIRGSGYIFFWKLITYIRSLRGSWAVAGNHQSRAVYTEVTHGH